MCTLYTKMTDDVISQNISKNQLVGVFMNFIQESQILTKTSDLRPCSSTIGAFENTQLQLGFLIGVIKNTQLNTPNKKPNIKIQKMHFYILFRFYMFQPFFRMWDSMGPPGASRNSLSIPKSIQDKHKKHKHGWV